MKKWETAKAEGRNRPGRLQGAGGELLAHLGRAARRAGALQCWHHPRGLRRRQGRRERVSGVAGGNSATGRRSQPRRALLRRATRRRRSRGSKRPSTPIPTHDGAGLRQPRRHRVPAGQGPATRRSIRRRSRSCAARSPSTAIRRQGLLDPGAHLLHDRGERSSPSSIWRTLVSSRPKRRRQVVPQFYNTLGLIQLRKKNVSLALKEFEQAVELDPKYIEAHLNIGAIGLPRAAVREGGERRSARCSSSTRRTSTRPSGSGSRCAAEEDRRGRELVQEGRGARPEELRGLLQPRRPLSGLQVATPTTEPQHGRRSITAVRGCGNDKRKSPMRSGASRTSTIPSRPSSSRRRWRPSEGAAGRDGAQQKAMRGAAEGQDGRATKPGRQTRARRRRPVTSAASRGRLREAGFRESRK